MKTTISKVLIVFIIYAVVMVFANEVPPPKIVSNAGHPIECHNANEKYSCGPACDNECSRLGVACSVVNIVCNHACYCKPGYARDSSWKCIPESSCPKSGDY